MNMKLWEKFGICFKTITLRHFYDTVLHGWQRWCRHVMHTKRGVDHYCDYDNSAPLIKLGPGGDYTREYFANEDNTHLVHRKQQRDARTMTAPVVKNNCLSNELQGCNFINDRGGVVNFAKHTHFTEIKSAAAGTMVRRRGLFLFG